MQRHGTLEMCPLRDYSPAGRESARFPLPSVTEQWHCWIATSASGLLTCGRRNSETVGFFGLNAYEWCTLNCTLNTYDASKPEHRGLEDHDVIFSQSMVDFWSLA